MSLPVASRRIAIGLALLGSGCVPAARGPAPQSVASAGRALPGTGPAIVATPLTETRTISFALDRIDQHDLPLDRTYRHFGTGRGVTVYVFDGGILDTHPELAGRVRRGFDAFPNEQRLCNPHGTAVAGAVAGTTLGVAPEAEIVDVKMVECRKLRGTIDAIVRGTRWVIADHARHPGTRAVANWSFIADTNSSIPALDSAVSDLRDAGIPVVVSAGNVERNACRISPANAPGTIVVGASRVRRSDAAAVRGPQVGAASSLMDERAPSTAYGSCVDLFAPGDSVLLPGMSPREEPTAQLWTGTSMAAGYVSGAVALFLEAHPRATPDQIGEHLRSQASRNSVDPERTPGVGVLFVGTNPTH